MVRSVKKSPWEGPDQFPLCTEGKRRLGKEKGLSQDGPCLGILPSAPSPSSTLHNRAQYLV